MCLAVAVQLMCGRFVIRTNIIYDSGAFRVKMFFFFLNFSRVFESLYHITNCHYETRFPRFFGEYRLPAPRTGTHIRNINNVIFV